MTFAFYLTGQVVRWVLAGGAILLGLGLGLDLVERSTDVLELAGGWGLLEYAALRLPLIATTLAPVAVLLGGALAFQMLAARSEIVALRAAGVSTLRLLSMLIPLAVVLGGGYGLLVDRVAAAADKALAERFAPLFSNDRIEGEVWVRTKSAILRAQVDAAEANAPPGGVVSSVSVFLIDKDGRISGRIDAPRGRYGKDGWTLESAEVWDIGATRGAPADMLWRTSIRPADMIAATRPDRRASAREASAVLAGMQVASRSESFYRFNILRSYAVWLAPAVLLLLAARGCFGLARSMNGMRRAAEGVALGFCFIALDGIASSMASTGAINAALAAFAPLAVFAAIGLWSLLTLEE